MAISAGVQRRSDMQDAGISQNTKYKI